MRQADRFDRLLHLGNVVVDVVLTVPALPERGGDVLASRAEAAAGGGFNVMAAAARQGLRAAYAGAHGTGPFGSLARAACAAEGIEVLQPAKAGPDTGFVVTMVEASGERTFLTSRGAEATLTAADLERVSPAARDAVYLSGYGLVHDSNRAALLGWLARLGAATGRVLRPRPAGGVHPGRGAGRRARPGRLADLQRAGGRHPHRQSPTRGRRQRSWLPGRAGRPRVLVRTGPGGCLIARPGAGVVARARVRGRAPWTPTAQATPTAARSSPRWRRARRTPPPRAGRTRRPRSRSPGAGRPRRRPARNSPGSSPPPERSRPPAVQIPERLSLPPDRRAGTSAAGCDLEWRA